MFGQLLPRAKVRLPGWLALLFLCGPLLGCAPLTGVVVNPPLAEEGEVFLFMQPMGEKALPLKFTISAISMRRADGVVVPLSGTVQTLLGADLVHKQSLLAKIRVPAGTYQGISLDVSRAELLGEEGPVALQVEPGPAWLPMEMAIPAKKAMALFLTFHADTSLESHVLFRPVFSVETTSQLPLARLGYLSMPNDNDLLIFHDNSMLLTGVIATGLQPRGMDMDRGRGRLYVALGGGAIAAFDLFQQAAIGTIWLRPGDDPQEVALSPDGTCLVSANYGSNTVSVLDPLTLVERGRVAVGAGPDAVVFSPAGHVAYSLDALANTVSVVDTDRMSLGATINLQESPRKGAVSRDGSELYVITENSPNLLLFDRKGSAGVQRIYVGMGACSLAVDTRSGFVYVGRKDGTIVVVDPTIGAYIDSLQPGGIPDSLALTEEGDFLFVLLSRQHALGKVNLVSKEVLGRLDLAGAGYGISLVGAR